MSSVTRAIVRMLCLVPVNMPPPDSVAGADLRTSMCDARAAVTLAAGGHPDIDGYRLEDARQLELFEVAS